MEIAISAALSSLIDGVPGISACKNEQSRFLYGNEAFKGLVGLDPEQDLKGMKDDDLPCEVASDAEVFRQQDRYIMKRQVAITTLNVHRFPDGASRAFMVLKEPFVDCAAGVRGVMFTGTEITPTHEGPVDWQVGSALAKHAAISHLSQGSFVIADSDFAVDMTPRENEVLFYLLRGGTAKKIGSKLSISSRTVEQYIDVLKDKFGVRTKADLVHRAISMGYLYFVPSTLQARCRTRLGGAVAAKSAVAVSRAKME